MKRITCLILVVICIFSLVGCETNEINYEQNLFEQSDEFREKIKVDVESAKQKGMDVNIFVEKISDDTYEVDFDGYKEKNILSANIGEAVNVRKVFDIGKHQNIATNAKNNVIKYINASKILKEKEMLIEEINKINVNVADMDAVGLYREGTVYISQELLNNFSKTTCEFALTHEYFHALASITNGGIRNEIYGKNKINEAITDILTAEMYPYLTDIESGYTEYYYYVLGYISCFKEKALEAHFYGYEDIWEKTGRDEFDFFVEMFAEAPRNVQAHTYYTALVNKWLD